MNSSNVIHLGDSESEFSGSIAWMEASDDLSSGSSVLGVQEYVDDTFLVPKIRARPSKKKKFSANLKNRNHVKNPPFEGITFEKAVLERYNFKKSIINNNTWKKKILEFKRDQSIISSDIISEKFDSPSIKKKSLPVLTAKVSTPEELNLEELSQKQPSRQESTCEENRMSFNLLDEKLNVPAEYLPVVLLERIQVPEKIVETSTANVESLSQPNQNSFEKNSSSFKKSNSVIDQKKYKCEQCDYKCNQKNYLIKYHMLIHTRGQQFKCPKCSHKTVRLRALGAHIKSVHNNEFPHRCPRCSIGCIELNQLTNHACFFATDRLFECDICKKRLAKRGTLDAHNRAYHSVGSFTCSFCQEIFRDKYSLELHRKNHTKNGSTLVCLSCTFQTKTPVNLKKHCIKHHKSNNNLMNN